MFFVIFVEFFLVRLEALLRGMFAGGIREGSLKVMWMTQTSSVSMCGC